MEFTGERFVPTVDWPEMAYEHWHRYLYATPYVTGKVVLDIACGEGYGTNYLAKTASRVIGADCDQAVICHASAKYVAHNLEFRRARLGNLSIFEDETFEVIV